VGLEVEMHQDNNGGGLQWFSGEKEIHIFNASTRTVYTQTSFIEISIEAQRMQFCSWQSKATIRIIRKQADSRDYTAG
jgi:hypothetical protein